MKKFLKITVQIFAELFTNIWQWFIISSRAIAVILNMLLPYAMYFIAQKDFVLTWDLIIPIVVLLLIYFLKQLGNKYGKGNTVPIPDKRFTSVDDEGEVSIEYDRLQELLLYTADLEDYLERKGLL